MSQFAPTTSHTMLVQQQPPRPAFPRCSSFFVESVDDNGIYAQREEERRRARAAARETQYALAEELSNVTCDEYQDDILDHMEQMESVTIPDVTFIDMQTEIQWAMRPFLIDFLIEAHASFQLLPETLYLAVNLLDRYCSKRVVYKRHYQLVGCSALLIAAKYGDRKDRVPTVKELKAMCCKVYEEEMFTQMEWHVLVTLDWTIGHPTVDSFLQVVLSEEPYDAQVEHLTGYLCEIALFHRDFVSLAPSTLSRTALALARCILSKEVDNSQYWSGKYDYAVFVELFRKAAAPSGVLQQKYGTPQFSSVAQTLALFVMEQARKERANAPATPPVGAPFEASVEFPQTPQKALPGPTSAYGYITPPITPDGQPFAQAPVKPEQHTWVPSTYTPPPSAEQMRQLSRLEVHSHYTGFHSHLIIKESAVGELT